jgi:L,D-transpeptidase YcbB
MNAAAEGLPDKIPYKDSLIQLFSEGNNAVRYANPRKDHANPRTTHANPRTDRANSVTAHADPQTELMLTAQYFNYARLAWGGISENQTRSINWFLPRKKIDLPALMDSLLNDKSSALIHHGYVYRQYGLLKGYLNRYRILDARGDWPLIKTSQKSLSIGDSSVATGILRKKLFLFGDLTDSSGSDRFDQDLKAGVQHYQHRLGMKEDGVAGPATIGELNKPVLACIRQILVNMERCRWVPVTLDRDYFVVNIPAFELFAYQKDSLLFAIRAVVGKSVHKTVIFNGNLQYVVFSPYWNVPSGILKNEVLPGIHRDPRYLQKHNMEWSGKTVRQKPGPANPLGQVKFLFPNQYDIYLHDSPAKGLFNEDTRAFSHGCIRLADARKVAHYLLRNDPLWPDRKIDSAMRSGKEKWVTLKDPVPVFIAYFTAWVDRQGKLNWRKDIYKRDDRLAAMLWNTTGKSK